MSASVCTTSGREFAPPLKMTSSYLEDFQAANIGGKEKLRLSHIFLLLTVLLFGRSQSRSYILRCRVTSNVLSWRAGTLFIGLRSSCVKGKLIEAKGIQRLGVDIRCIS